MNKFKIWTDSQEGVIKSYKGRDFFLNIALFISISKTSIDLQGFSEVGQRPIRRTRQQQVASDGCD
jgi:hypothetical protein